MRRICPKYRFGCGTLNICNCWFEDLSRCGVSYNVIEVWKCILVHKNITVSVG